MRTISTDGFGCLPALPTGPQCLASLKKSADSWLLLAAVAVANFHLISGAGGGALIFFPGAVAAGQWWRLLTFPLVHISWYHLLLDAGAFFLLYRGLEEKRIWIKALYTGICSLSSLLFSLSFSALIDMKGLCGLSGIAHGLMAISALEMIRDPAQCRAGIITLFILCVKSLYEALSGQVFLAFLHMGLCGTPVAVSHLGGVVGGVFIFLVLLPRTKR